MNDLATSGEHRPQFFPAREQDAWGTIRGFVYQVNLTIDRWLSLPDDGILELEHGEDIDHVIAAVNAGCTEDRPDDSQRLLEQIKHLDSNVTLRHPSAIKSICDFLAHRAENPELQLRFRHTTNAAAGVERPPAIASSPKIGAIHLWSVLHSGRALPNGLTASQALEGIRAILRSVVRPEAVSRDEDWKRFEQLVASNDNIARITETFEWGTNQTQHADIVGTLRERLQRLKHAQTADEARQQHERLFLAVFNRLSETGIKRLHAADLGAALRAAPATQRDRKLLGLLVGWFKKLERTVQEHDRRLIALDKTVEGLAKASDAAVRVSQFVTVPETAPPPLLDRCCKRTTTMNSVTSDFAPGRWLAMSGPFASGKSELALLITDRFSPGLWIQLRGLDEREASLRIDAVIDSLLSHTPNDTWLLADDTALHSVLNRYGVVVLDDIPELREGDLSRRVICLARACSALTTRLITTSNKPVSASVSERVGDTLVQLPVPAFTKNETWDLLSLHGMPSDWHERRVEYIQVHASGNPAILTAVARHFDCVGWQDDAAWFDTLVQGNFGHELNDETISRLLETVDDQQAKELLFRLREVVGNITNEHIDLVANVPEPISAPLERLVALTGLWLQRTGEGRFAVSPLIKRLGPINLTADTRRATNAALARQLLRRETIDTLQASIALGHLVAAEEWDRAAILLAQAHMQSSQSGIKSHDFTILQSWASAPLPAKISPPLRLFIRALQFGRDDKSEDQAQLYLSDIRSLLEAVEADDNWAAAAVAVYAGTELPKRDLELALKIQVRAATFTGVEGREEAFSEARTALGLGSVGLESLIWFSAGEVREFSEIESVLDAISDIPASARRLAAVGDVAARAQQILAQRLWLAECERDEADRNWPGVLEKLERIRKRAITLGLVWLRVFLDRTRMVVQAEHLKNLDAAVAIAEESQNAKDLDDDQRFMLEECIALQHLDAKDYASARTLLSRAITRTGQLFPEERVVANICFSNAIGIDDAEGAIPPAQCAVELGAALADSIGLYHVKALGELGIAQYYYDGPRAAYDVLEQAANVLLKAHSAYDEWKVSLRVLMQVLLNIVLETSEKRSSVDQTDMTPLSRGLMLAPGTPQLVEKHTDHTEHGLFTLMATLAECLGLDDQACDWAYRAIRPPRGQPNALVLSTSMPKVIPSLLAQRRYPEALDAAILSCSGFVAAKLLMETGRSDELETAVPSEVLQQADENASSRVNEITSQMFLVPASASVARRSLDVPEAARGDAQELAGLFRQIALRDSGPTWERAAALMEGFANGTSAQYIINMCNESGDTVVQVCGYLLASTLDSITINDSWRLHNEALSWLDEKWRSGSPLIYRMIVLPFFEAYWRDRVERQRFQFTPPGLVAELFAEAVTTDEVTRGRAILSAVSFGLKLS